MKSLFKKYYLIILAVVTVTFLLLFSFNCFSQSVVGMNESEVNPYMTKQGLFYRSTFYYDKGGRQSYETYKNDSVSAMIHVERVMHGFLFWKKTEFICFREKWIYPISMLKPTIKKLGKSMATVPTNKDNYYLWEFINENGDIITCELAISERFFTVIFQKK